MIDFRLARFQASGADRHSFLLDREQVVFLGRSNAGKSSLINKICDNKKLMKVSKEAGRTRMMNYLDLDGRFYLVDAPGYGYAERGDFVEMLSSYFALSRTRIRKVYLLIDPLRDLKPDDFQLLEMLEHYSLPSLIVLSKADKLRVKDRLQAQRFSASALAGRQSLFFSAVTGEGLKELRRDIAMTLEHNH